tara:strand:+ start:231 stop:386 length:156 start_codon:yes stop_codon:yes gene_type:complete
MPVGSARGINVYLMGNSKLLALRMKHTLSRWRPTDAQGTQIKILSLHFTFL